MKRYGLLLLLLSSYLCHAADAVERARINALVRPVSAAERARLRAFASLLRGAEYFIKIRTTSGQFIVTMPNGATYGDLKQEIEKQKKIPVDNQVLWLRGQKLSDDDGILVYKDDSPRLEIVSKIAYSPIGWLNGKD